MTENYLNTYATQDPLRQLIFGLPTSVNYFNGLPEEHIPSILQLLDLYRISMDRGYFPKKESVSLSMLAPLFDKMNHRLMLLNLKMLDWNRDRLTALEEHSQVALPNHHLALDIWDFNTIVDAYKGKHYGKPLDIVTRFLYEANPLYNRIRSKDVIATHQTRTSNAESIRSEGLINISQPTNLARFTGVNVGLFGCYHNWVNHETAEAFSFELPLRSIYPRFISAGIPRVSAIYPTELQLENSGRSSIWGKYAILWPRKGNRFQKKALMSMYTEGRWKLDDIGEDHGEEVHYIQTDDSYFITATLCDVLGMTDIYAIPS